MLIWHGVCAQLPRTIFAIEDEPLTSLSADDDDEMGLESLSDPAECVDAEGADDDEGSMRFFDEGSPSAHGVSSNGSRAHSSTHYRSDSDLTMSSARTRSED
jgi:cysteine protease ATG4